MDNSAPENMASQTSIKTPNIEIFLINSIFKFWNKKLLRLTDYFQQWTASNMNLLACKYVKSRNIKLFWEIPPSLKLEKLRIRVNDKLEKEGYTHDLSFYFYYLFILLGDAQNLYLLS